MHLTRQNFESSFVYDNHSSLSFLDDIFLAEPSQRKAKPPPKNKSPRTPQKSTADRPAKGALSGVDADPEDPCRGVAFSPEPESVPVRDGGAALWRRNSKFAPRPGPAALEAQMDQRSVFEKYAESFVHNEHFGRRRQGRGRDDGTSPKPDDSADA